MADASKQFLTIEDNLKKIDLKLKNDYQSNLDAGKRAISDSKQLLTYSYKLVRFFLNLDK